MVLDAKLTSCYKLLTSEIKNSIFLNISYTNKIGSIVIYNYRQIGPLQYFRDDKAKQLLLPYKALLHLLELRYDSIDVGDIMVPYEKKYKDISIKFISKRSFQQKKNLWI